MKAKVLLLGLLVTPFVLGGCSRSFSEFTSKDGKFKVLMPGTPKEQNKQTPFGNIKLYIFDEGNVGNVVGYVDLPINTANESEAQIQARVDGAAQGIASNIGGKFLSQSQIKLDNKYPGREFFIEGSGGKGFVKGRVYLVKNRLYQIMSAGKEKSLVDSTNTAKFLGSFQLLK